jgi:hypothetical protein
MVGLSDRRGFALDCQRWASGSGIVGNGGDSEVVRTVPVLKQRLSHKAVLSKEVSGSRGVE